MSFSSNSNESPSSVDPLDAAVDVLPAGTVVGRYVILHLVGHGGAGLVYAAYDAELDRKLALKFLRVRGGADGLHEASHRLRREAKSMARLSHPNVVSIHDVGRVSGHMFLVMDFVPGGTLKEWLATPRPWRERLDLVCRAGDGLAAAHAAGLVHRDFKPANVLIDGDLPRVTDFGVAAAERGPAPQPVPREPGASEPPGLEPRTEGVLGTVGYLAPEQAYLAPVDARADQFSFCVTLYQALYGALPFVGPDLLSYLDSVSRGQLATGPGASERIPRAIHTALRRGLSENPDDRFPSMDALLAELRRDRAREARQRWFAWGLAGACVLALGIAARARGERPRVCPVPDEELGGAWSAAERDRVESAFTAAASFGKGAYVPVAAGIDRYARSVAHMRVDACEAARVHATQSESVMTLRLQCLDERAKELGALVRLFGAADQGVVDGAAESLGKLSAVSECADVASLTAPTPPPTPALASSVQAVRSELAEVRASSSVKRFDEAVARAMDLVARAKALAYAPLVAEAKLVLGKALHEKGQDEPAVAMLKEAADTADEGKHDLARGQALVACASVEGRQLGHYDAAIDAATTALHVARRLGSDALAADALQQLGMDHGRTGRVEEGLRESTAALAIKERLEGPDDVDLAATHVAISIALSELGRFDDSQREDRRALEIVEKAYGPSHPHAAIYLGNLSVDLVWAGHAEEAVPIADEGIRILRAAIGTEHPDYALLVNYKSYALTKLGRFAEAKPLNEEAVAVAERTGGRDSASVAYPLVGLGEDLIGLGKASEALPLLERATRLAEANALDPETMGECHYHLARAVWLASKDAPRAAALAWKAAADYRRSPRLAASAAAAEDFAKAREAGLP